MFLPPLDKVQNNWIIDFLDVHPNNKEALGLTIRPRRNTTWIKGMHKEAAEFLQNIIDCNTKTPDVLGMYVWGHFEVIMNISKEADNSWGSFYIQELRYLCYLTIPRHYSTAYASLIELDEESLHYVYETKLRNQPGVSTFGPIFHKNKDDNTAKPFIRDARL